MTDFTDVDLVAALAAVQDLDIGEVDQRALASWFADIRRGLDDLRRVDIGDVLQVDPLLACPWLSDGPP